MDTVCRSIWTGIGGADADAAIDEQRRGLGVLDHFDARMTRDALPEHAADLAPGRVARVQHAPDTVRGLTRERQPALIVAVEPGAPFDQLANVARPLVRQHVDRLRQTQLVAS